MSLVVAECCIIVFLNVPEVALQGLYEGDS